MDSQGSVTSDSGTETQRIIEYYQPVFAELSLRLQDQFDHAALVEPRLLERSYWHAFSGHLLLGERAWTALADYARHITTEIDSIVKRHSCYFWIHLYRRIGVGLHHSYKSKTDAHTTALVRDIVETAFVRGGLLPSEPTDIRLSQEVDLGDVLGGLYREVWLGILKDSDRLNEVFSDLRKTNQWVLTDFSERDFVDVVRIEALAYEYWLTTARMRAVGKGSQLEVSRDGTPHSRRGDELEKLLEHYDRRIESQPFATSNIAVSFASFSGSRQLFVVLPTYNVDQLPFSQLPSPVDDVEVEDIVTNFWYGGLDIGNYFASHEFADQSFLTARGFALSSLCGYLAAIVHFEFAQIAGTEIERVIRCFQLYQRAYRAPRADLYFDALGAEAFRMMDEWLGAGNHRMIQDVEAVREFLTLRPEKQAMVSLWSQGPRYAFIPYGPAVVVDLEGLTTVLDNAFFKVQHDQAAKGELFEEHFRKSIERANLELLEERHLKYGKIEREVDAGVRVGNTLFLCECRAMERPLDFEIGRLKTIELRNLEFSKKVNQAASLEEFVRVHPLGSNYDFTWADRIVSIVVSPFIEWIWSREPSLWLTDSVPRILSAREAIDYIGLARI